ncbi:class F sortase [Kocuria sediminis]|uniref:Class F sortase n=1 Tax=Kocuria sediminis TaxID=1038857 RepID=A0A6N8GJ16_9MICC|nr:class F sortase [Kocuria sediminis]MUN62270.1 class F sortase [Kocuria sediminis]
MDPTQHQAPRRRSVARWTAAAGGLAAVAVLSTVLLTDPLGATPPEPAPQAPAASVTAAPTPAPAAEAAPEPDAARPEAAAPVRLRVEDAQLDVAVLPLAPSEQELATEMLVPPDTLDGYWLTPYGMPGEGSENTTYITGHSWEGRDAPFNRLSDPGLVGSEIELETETGTLEYRVDSVVTHDKNTLKDSDIWRIVPDRLVVVSCYTEDLWGKNVVLTASPVPPEQA